MLSVPSVVNFCRLVLGALALALLSPLATGRAHAWEPFRSESGAVERGNEQLSKGQAKEALAAYDQAARDLPTDPGVQLDRGLALLALGKLGEAREALRRAGTSGAPKELRGAALYDLGLAFMKEAELAAKAEDFDGAKKMLEEAVDSLKNSLRAQPNRRDAGWNLELAKRRLKDAQDKQDEKKKKEEEQKKQKKDEQKDQNQDPDQQKPPGQDGGTQQPQPDAGAPERGDAGQPNPKDEQGEPDAGAPPTEPEPKSAGDAGPQAPEAAPQPPSTPPPNALPEHMERALDALESSEQNLEKFRARQRARSQPRRIEKDW